jgi:hypothetical protein
MEYQDEARRWVDAIPGLTPGERTRRVQAYAAALERYFQDAITAEVALHGPARVEEWARLRDYGGQYLPIWLRWNLPGYFELRAEIFARARLAILGR